MLTSVNPLLISILEAIFATMITKKYRWIFYLIAITIVATIGIQFYWNFKNYQENKRQVTNEIQLSLDNAVEEYYSSQAKSDFLTIINKNKDENVIRENSLGSVLNKLKLKKTKPKFTITNLKFTTDENMSQKKRDSIMKVTSAFVTEFNFNKDSVSKTKNKAKKAFKKKELF